MIATTAAAVPRPGGLGITATVPVARGHEILAQAKPSDLRPVEQPSDPQGAGLGRDGAQLPHKRSVARGQDAAQAEAPQDRAIFRAQVIKVLMALHQDDQSFQKALKRGTIIIRATPDPSPQDLRLERSYELYRKAAREAVRQAEAQNTRPGRSLPSRIGPQDFIAWWPGQRP